MPVPALVQGRQPYITMITVSVPVGVGVTELVGGRCCEFARDGADRGTAENGRFRGEPVMCTNVQRLKPTQHPQNTLRESRHADVGASPMPLRPGGPVLKSRGTTSEPARDTVGKALPCGAGVGGEGRCKGGRGPGGKGRGGARLGGAVRLPATGKQGCTDLASQRPAPGPPVGPLVSRRWAAAKFSSCGPG
jgi:hypothetical protein